MEATKQLKDKTSSPVENEEQDNLADEGREGGSRRGCLSKPPYSVTRSEANILHLHHDPPLAPALLLTLPSLSEHAVNNQS